MIRFQSIRPVLVVLSAFVLASCADQAVTDPLAPSNAALSKSPGSSVSSAVTDPSQLNLQAVWWKKQHKTTISVSKTISASGGTISIPETGFSMSFPAGAVSGPIKITVTSDDKYVAYKMEPTGTRFAKDVTVTQQLNTTTLYGQPLHGLLYVGYIGDDTAKLTGHIPVLELEPSKTIFSPLSALLPEAHVWIIRHFSRYMLASG
ncbi:MAG TPA: hypothetical protein VGD02_07710 [Gemmatimonadaceae bacterium]|jgi:hypothetical protein